MLRASATVMLLVLTGCASMGEGGVARRGGYDAPISREEIEQRDYETAYDIVQSLRPRWLGQSRGAMSVDLGSAVHVYVNGVRRGGPDELYTIPATGIREIRYYDSRDATMRFGTGHPEGVIEVVL